MDMFITAITEDMKANFESSLVDDDSTEEAFCFLTNSKSSYELLDEYNQKEE